MPIEITSDLNPDAMDVTDVQAVREQLGQQINQLKQLDRYLDAIISAKTLRLEGKIAMAITFEQVADGVYKHLPEWAKW